MADSGSVGIDVLKARLELTAGRGWDYPFRLGPVLPDPADTKLLGQAVGLQL